MSPFEWQVRLYYEDTDNGVVVYYELYKRFMQRARTEYLRRLGFEQARRLRDDATHLAVRQVAIDYHAPARFNEMLNVSVEIAQLSRASMTFAQRVVRTDDNDTLLCSANIKVACLTASTFSAQPIPDFIIKEIEHVD